LNFTHWAHYILLSTAYHTHSTYIFENSRSVWINKQNHLVSCNHKWGQVKVVIIAWTCQNLVVEKQFQINVLSLKKVFYRSCSHTNDMFQNMPQKLFLLSKGCYNYNNILKDYNYNNILKDTPYNINKGKGNFHLICLNVTSFLMFLFSNIFWW